MLRFVNFFILINFAKLIKKIEIKKIEISKKKISVQKNRKKKYCNTPKWG